MILIQGNSKYNNKIQHIYTFSKSNNHNKTIATMKSPFSFNCKYTTIESFLADKRYSNFIMAQPWIKNDNHIKSCNLIKSYQRSLNTSKEYKHICIPEEVLRPKFTSGKFSGGECRIFTGVVNFYSQPDDVQRYTAFIMDLFKRDRLKDSKLIEATIAFQKYTACWDAIDKYYERFEDALFDNVVKNNQKNIQNDHDTNSGSSSKNDVQSIKANGVC